MNSRAMLRNYQNISRNVAQKSRARATNLVNAETPPHFRTYRNYVRPSNEYPVAQFEMQAISNCYHPFLFEV